MSARFSPETLALGLGLISLGVVATLGNMGRLDTLHTLRTFWPMALVLWGVLELVNAYVNGTARRSR